MLKIIAEPPFTKLIYNYYEGGPIIHLGPWVGEFGYEVCTWGHYVRRVVADNPNAHIVISGDMGHHPLYQDMADEYWILPPIDGPRLCEWRDNSIDLGVKERQGPLLIKLMQSLGDAQTIWPRYINENEKLYKNYSPTPVGRDLAEQLIQKHRVPDKFVLIFPRLRPQPPFSVRNYPYWQQLAETLSPSIFVISSGRAEDSLSLENVLNLMEEVPALHELDITMALMERASAIVGTNSGAALLAMYLGKQPLVIGPKKCADMLHIVPHYIGDGTYTADPTTVAKEILGHIG